MTTLIFHKELPPLTNLDLEELVKELKIKDFRGVFMRDGLPQEPLPSEVEIINLDSSNNLKKKMKISSKCVSQEFVPFKVFTSPQVFLVQ